MIDTQKNKSKKIIVTVLSWLFVFAILTLIFMLSNQAAAESTELSEGLLEKICRLLGIHAEDDHILRKLAHASEYFVLEAFMFFAIYQTKGRPMPVLSISVTVLYSISDEIHQYFVPGRACRIKDVLIDLSGSMISVVICMIMFKVIRNIVLNKK